MVQVDVWATGILAYELVVGRPPFEVNDEVQTATMIMFNNNISYPGKFSSLWADFVKQSLEKKPHLRYASGTCRGHLQSSKSFPARHHGVRMV